MKLFLSLVTTLLVIFIVISCEDMLVESPKSIVVENFYSNVAEAEAGVSSIYEPLHRGFEGRYMSIMWSQTDYGAGYIDSYAGNSDIDAFKSFQNLPSVSINLLTPVWNNFYKSILHANLVINFASESEELSQEEINRYVAEAKFMRAFSYFYLVRHWGDVPLYTEENYTEDTGLPKSSKEEIYKFMIDELESSYMYLPDDPPLLGRASKTAAKTLLADIYFYNENYSAALELANEIIESGKHQLEIVEEESDFDKIFGPNPSTAEEILFFHYNENNSNATLVFLLPPTHDPWWGGSTAFGHAMSASGNVMYQNWDDEDLRKKHTWSKALGGDNRLPDEDPFFPTDTDILVVTKYRSPETRWAPNPIPIYRYSYVLLLHAEASARVNGGPTVESLESLNMVRRRAYGFNPNEQSPIDLNLTDYDLESFIDRIIKERGYEFQFEGNRWFDLVRTGRVFSVIKEHTGRDVLEKRLLWPIPQQEFDLNESLDPSDQNPGW